MADLSHLSRTLRLVLESAPEAPSLTTLLALVDSFVLQVANSPSPGPLLSALEDELQEICDSVVELDQREVFLAVLYHLQPILPPASLIERWFDLILRRALREPRLPRPALDHAKELIIAALDSCTHTDIGAKDASEEEREKERERQREKVGEFRRRLMDLYLLDAYNESSGEDVIEWAALDGDERGTKASWKNNLEDVLVKGGLERPQDFLTEVYHCFSSPSSRLQLLILLNVYTSQPGFTEVASVLAGHRLMTCLLHSLLFDGSSTAANIALTVITKLLPIVAVKACEDLKGLLPLLLAVLARIICWRERELPVPAMESLDGETVSDVEDNADTQSLAFVLDIREDLEWTRLEQTFACGASSAPSAHRYFTHLYYLFPCNTLRFLRHPIQYMKDSELESPYNVGWEDALDEDQIRSRSEPLMRGHVLHPLLIWRTPAEELSKPDFWTQYDIARIVGDCTMLDVRNTALGMQQRTPTVLSTDPEPASAPLSSSALATPLGPQSLGTSTVSSPTVRPVDLSSGKPQVSLQDMIETSIALRSGLDVEIVQPAPAWSSGAVASSSNVRPPSVFTMDTAAPEHRSTSPPTSIGDAASVRPGSIGGVSVAGAGGDHVPVQMVQALAGLQREVLLLRNELNFELWNARENVKHIGRLYQDRVLSKTAEMERQGLHNKLREYKQEIGRLQRELKEHKNHATHTKNQYEDWNRKMQDKLKESREERKKREANTTKLSAEKKDVQAAFVEQGKQLAESVQKVFLLETQIKENAHKVDRLRDYEKQIDQLIKLQQLWEMDVQKLNDQAEYLQVVTSKYKKMEIRLETYEKTHTEMDTAMRNYQHEIEASRAHLALAQREGARKASIIAKQSTAGAEIAKLTRDNQRLRDENSELRDEIEKLKEMVEILKARSERGRAVARTGSLPVGMIGSSAAET